MKKARRCRNRKGQFMKCKGKRRSGRRKARAGFTFDGTKCRDSEGKYVPVLECRPMRGKRQVILTRRTT